MTEQTSLFGDDAAQVNLFLAAFPDAAARAAIDALARAVCADPALRATPRSAQLLHLTLQHLGTYAGLPPRIEERVAAALAGFAATPFALAFDRVGSFVAGTGRQPCVLLGCDGDVPLQQLQRALAERLARAGFGRHVQHGFVPHVTLCYARSALATVEVAPIGWQVEEFVLVSSLIGRGEYRVLARWPLQAAAG